VITWPDPLPSYGSVVLRPFRPDDLPLVEALAGDPYLPLIGSIPSPYSEAEGLAYLERQHQRLADGTGYSFAIADRATDRALGGAGLWLQAPVDRATLGYAVAPADRGRGVATQALMALTAFGWSLSALTRLELYIEGWNVGSIRAAERCGFTLEAHLPAHTVIGGVRRDMLRYVLERAAR
jgi:ribosomal-protein-alanine N-acetyltransferase